VLGEDANRGREHLRARPLVELDGIAVGIVDQHLTAARAHLDLVAEARARNEVEVGPGGSQVLVDDPDGNPVELHERPRE